MTGVKGVCQLELEIRQICHVAQVDQILSYTIVPVAFVRVSSLVILNDFQFLVSRQGHSEVSISRDSSNRT